jgi:hypothetical protein
MWEDYTHERSKGKIRTVFHALKEIKELVFPPSVDVFASQRHQKTLDVNLKKPHLSRKAIDTESCFCLFTFRGWIFSDVRVHVRELLIIHER